MKILVIGGLDFIGSNFVRYTEDKAEIVVVDALKYGSNETNLKDLDCKVVNGDICDYELMAELVKGVDAIVNFAAETHVDRSISNNYGPYQFPEKLIPKAILRAKMDMKIPIYGNGKNVRDWIFVEDHCEAINLVLEKGERGEIYNVSGGEEKTNLAVINELLEVMAKTDLIEFVEDRPGHDLRYSLDSSNIRELGGTPMHSFKEGLKETVVWYLENEWWWQPLADERILHPTPWKLDW